MPAEAGAPAKTRFLNWKEQSVRITIDPEILVPSVPSGELNVVCGVIGKTCPTFSWAGKLAVEVRSINHRLTWQETVLSRDKRKYER